MSNLQNQLVVTETEEVRKAIRVLLRTPLIVRDSSPDDYDLVRRRQIAVSAWFQNYLGWELRLHPRSGHVRLVKVAPPDLVPDDVRPARQHRSGVPFDRHRYVLLCVVGAELVSRRVVTLGELAEAAAHSCSTDAALPPFDTKRHGHRRAFVDAVLQLEEAGILRAVEGRAESFTDDATTAVLYQVEQAGLFSLLAAPVGASSTAVNLDQDEWLDDAVDALLAEPAYGEDYRDATRPGAGPLAPPEDDAARTRRNLWLRHSTLRAVFDDPALHRDRLSPAQRDYLDSISGREQLRKAAETAGFVLETRAEGYLLVDRERISTDEVFPGDGAPSVAALHLVTVLTSSPAGSSHIDLLRSAIADLLAANRGWARTYQDDDGPDRLLAEAIGLLGRHHLVTRDGAVVTARPAAHRYRDATFAAAPARNVPEESPA
ncbi:TIGR02678 family protein [Promicromonospora umidemergens]|uniref:TIGR02678 family protein n=1 Tax=Promicromonospora umidemergens TaxID=629679 RepID=A0ABP8WGG3_9MICO|nr:TIGR02678 family protein [Promicromonospora umidemergens]MCP2284086.1 TIGR02678 family protein [Promicromonospora umidemergens]